MSLPDRKIVTRSTPPGFAANVVEGRHYSASHGTVKTPNGCVEPLRLTCGWPMFTGASDGGGQSYVAA